MRKNDKPKKRKAKYPQRKVTTTNDPTTREKFYAETDAAAPLGPYQLAAGTVQHPDTQLWQVWISTNGLDLNYLSAHRDKSKAEEAVEQFRQFAQTEDIYDPEKVTALYEQLIRSGDAEPIPLPDELVRKIGRDILHSVIETKK